MTKETKTRAELQALFAGELSKLGAPDVDKPTIKPVANNARFTWSVFQANAGKLNDDSEAVENLIGRLQDRYDLSDES